MRTEGLAGLALVMALASAADAAPEGERARVVLLEVGDHSGQGVRAAVRRTLEDMLSRHAGLVLVSRKPLVASLKRARVAAARWLEPEVLREHAQGIDVVLAARFQRGGAGYELLLTAHDLTSGDVIELSSGPIEYPRVTQAIAEQIVVDLARRLIPDAAPRAEPPPPAPAADEGWDTADLSFEEVTRDNAVTPSVLWSGRVEVQHHRFADDLGPSALNGRDSVEARVRAKAGNDAALAYAELTARRDFDAPERDRFDVTEAYGQLQLGPVSLRAGRLVVGWGTATFFNPSDVLNPVDFRDVLRPEKLGAFMVRAGVVAGPVLVEAYYLPVPELHALPLPTAVGADGELLGPSRWVRGRLTLDTPPGLSLRYVLEEPRARRARLKNAQGAARVAFSAGGVDASIGYVSLFERVPMPRVTLTPDALDPTAADVHVDFTTRRLHVLTADFETTLGKLRLAAEAALAIPRAPFEDDSYASAVVSVDYRTPQFASDHALHVLVDGVWSRLDGLEAIDGGAGVFVVPFKRAVLARLVYEAGQALRVTLEGAAGLTGRDLYARPSVEYIAASLVHLRVGYDWLYGDDDGFFGRYEENSRAFVELEAVF